jgi:4-carboxymuconolactone decarboxylase
MNGDASDPRNPDENALDPRNLIWGDHKTTIETRLRELDPDLERYVREFAYGEVYGRSDRGGLSPKIQEFLAVVMLISLGNPTELKTHLRGALNAGATEHELREVILFGIPYLGFPRAIGAMQVLKQVLEKL